MERDFSCGVRAGFRYGIGFSLVVILLFKFIGWLVS